MGKQNLDDTIDKSAKWDELLTRINQIASPLASRKMSKKLYKAIKKGNKHRTSHNIAQSIAHRFLDCLESRDY